MAQLEDKDGLIIAPASSSSALKAGLIGAGVAVGVVVVVVIALVVLKVI